MIYLNVYVQNDCWGCEESRRLAADIREQYPDIAVGIVDIGEQSAAVPKNVFATPTWMLDNRVIALGNPTREQLHIHLKQRQAGMKHESR